MRAYAIRRLLMVIPTLFLVTVLVFLSVRFLPGDVIGIMESRMQASQGGELDRAAVERRLGLDVPVYVQYGRWVGGIFLRGTLGQSLMGGDTVEQSIAQRLPVTLQLGLMAILIGLVIAVPVGIYSAIRQDTTGDYVGRERGQHQWRRPAPPDCRKHDHHGGQPEVGRRQTEDGG